MGDVNDIREKAELDSIALFVSKRRSLSLHYYDAIYSLQVEFILLLEHLPLFSWMRSKRRKEILTNEKEMTIKPDKFPNKYTNWFWFRALQLSYFDTYDYRIIKPDLSEVLTEGYMFNVFCFNVLLLGEQKAERKDSSSG